MIVLLLLVIILIMLAPRFARGCASALLLIAVIGALALLHGR